MLEDGGGDDVLLPMRCQAECGVKGGAGCVGGGLGELADEDVGGGAGTVKDDVLELLHGRLTSTFQPAIGVGGIGAAS